MKSLFFFFATVTLEFGRWAPGRGVERVSAWRERGMYRGYSWGRLRERERDLCGWATLALHSGKSCLPVTLALCS